MSEETKSEGKYINSCLAVYDLHGYWREKEDPGYDYYFYEKNLSNGLNIKIRADGYYVLDFCDCSIGAPIKYDDSKLGEIHVILNQRVEVAHALLACLRVATQRETRVLHTIGMDFIDNFISCSREAHDIETLLEKYGFFSSEHYKKLCESRLKEMQGISTSSNLNRRKIFEETATLLDKLGNSEKGQALYILGILYRTAVYHHMGLAIHSAIFLRSVFEWLANRAFPEKKDKKERYEGLLNKYQYDDKNSRERCLIEQLSSLRGGAVHKLEFPQSNPHKDPIPKSFTIIQKMFCSEMGIEELSIPIGKGMSLCF